MCLPKLGHLCTYIAVYGLGSSSPVKSLHRRLAILLIGGLAWSLQIGVSLAQSGMLLSGTVADQSGRVPTELRSRDEKANTSLPSFLPEVTA
jgi:hypothetical protein